MADNAITSTTPLSSKPSRKYKKLILKIHYGKTVYTLDLENFCSILTVKHVIRDKSGIDVKIQELSLGQRKLSDKETLSQMNLEKQRTLHILLTLNNVVEIKIVSKEVNLNCKIHKTYMIRDLQTALCEKTNIPIEQQYLVFNDQILDSRQPLLHYDIPDGATIEVLRKIAC